MSSFTIEITEEALELAGLPQLSDDDLDEVAQMMLEEYEQGQFEDSLIVAVNHLLEQAT